MPTLVVGMLAVSLRSLGKHGTHQAWCDKEPGWVQRTGSLGPPKSLQPEEEDGEPGGAG
jgi:hypothetical protein